MLLRCTNGEFSTLFHSRVIRLPPMFSGGEQSKNLNTIADIYDTLADFKMTRKDLIVALGGGVTGDMAGFAAATYLRGIDFVQIPTSLLHRLTHP